MLGRNPFLCLSLFASILAGVSFFFLSCGCRLSLFLQICLVRSWLVPCWGWGWVCSGFCRQWSFSRFRSPRRQIFWSTEFRHKFQWPFFLWFSVFSLLLFVGLLGLVLSPVSVLVWCSGHFVGSEKFVAIESESFDFVIEGRGENIVRITDNGEGKRDFLCACLDVWFSLL